MSRKLTLVFVDSLRTDTLLQAASDGDAPAFASLLERGELVPDCVSSFPSVTPVCSAEIATGEGPGPLPGEPGSGHWISGMNWYDRLEQRYVEYGTSFEATRTFGLFRALYDIVYNMNMAHLSHEVDTVFERLGDAGVRTACTPFLIYRGRTRHDLGLEGLMKRMAAAASFRHSTWGPDELFWGELYASRRVPCKPTLARPGTRDEYSACVGRELVREDLYDFLLYSLPDHDYHSHKNGPGDTAASIAHADRCFGDLADAAGGIDEFCERNAVILMADHGQTEVSEGVDLAGALGAEWRVLEPNDPKPEAAELAVAPTARAAGIYVLAGGSRRLRAHEDVRTRLGRLDGIDLFAWLAGPDGDPLERDGAGPVRDDGIEAVVEAPGRDGVSLHFRPGSALRDRRGRGWQVDGDLEALALSVSDGEVSSDAYPDALGRLWSALAAPQAGDLLVSLALGYECVDWGNMTHVGGGSHGSLHAEDSLVPLLMCGLEPGTPETRAQWKLCDVSGLVLSHFGLGEGPVVRSAAAGTVEHALSGTAEETAAPAPPRGGGSRAAEAAWGLVRRVHLGSRKPANWLQLFKFGVVGASGYAINLLVFAVLTGALDVHHIVAAIAAFGVAVSSNFFWNRHWTFGASEGHAGFQAARFFTVSVVGLGVNLAVLAALVDVAGLAELPSQALAVAVAMPVNFIGNKLWTFDSDGS